MNLDSQNLAYALTQVAHNFGAVAVVGGAVVALVWREVEVQRKLAWMVLAGWLVQALSGATFGAISYYFYAKFPDIHSIALVALKLKVVCAALGFIMAAWLLKAQPSVVLRRYVWIALCGVGVLALSSAAILRWFS